MQKELKFYSPVELLVARFYSIVQINRDELTNLISQSGNGITIYSCTFMLKLVQMSLEPTLIVNIVIKNPKAVNRTILLRV